MGTFRTWLSRFCCSSALCMILITTSAEEVYDDGDLDQVDPQGPDKEELRLFSNLIEYMQPKPRLDLRHIFNVDQHGDQDLLEMKTLMQKRIMDVKMENKKVPMPRPEQKWKIKKGKALRSRMICYFKLCTFRPMS